MDCSFLPLMARSSERLTSLNCANITARQIRQPFVKSAYPVMRLVALMNLGSHVLLDAATAPYRRSEILLAHAMLTTIPDNSITLFDRLFYSADLLLTLNQQGSNRHWLLPARKDMVAETEVSYGAGDRLLKLNVSPQARKKNPSLPEYWYARAVTEQEVWGMLLAHNLIRREATKAAEKHKKAPSEISFKFAFKFIATEMIVLGNTVSPGTIPKRLEHLRGNLEAVFITKRPLPSRPRAVKMSKTRYPVKRSTAPLN